jgi:hypothetical protein
MSRRRALPAACIGLILIVLAIVIARQSVTPSAASAPANGVPTGHLNAAVSLPDEPRIIGGRERAQALARAQVWRAPNVPVARAFFGADRTTPSSIECRFRLMDVGGTTPKFHCVLESGKDVRAKYGPGSEIPGEAAATRLLSALGFGADTVTLVERLRCHGCPNEPYVTGQLVEATGAQPLYERVADPDDVEEFQWVSVEQKFAARPIETERQKGWGFFELESIDPSKGGAPRAHVDALRLIAVFLSHWDNKSENQRLVCLSESWPEGTACPEPFLILQDVGSTFGPRRVDLDGWATSKIWEDRAACRISMSDLPYGGGTFGPTRVSDRGRRFLVKMLGALTDAQLTDLFATARFDQPRTALTSAKPVSDWVRVFKQRVRAISDGPPCPDA